MPVKKQDSKKKIKPKKEKPVSSKTKTVKEKPVSSKTKLKTKKSSVKAKPAKKIIKKPAAQSVKKPVFKKIAKKETTITSKIWATGKRKTSIAQVQCFPQGKGDILVNQKTVKEYFPVFELRERVLSPLKTLNKEKDFDFKVKVQGGGIHGQADAVSLGISRALVLFNPEWRKELKSKGLLRRDPRKKERKKPGLKRARRAPQWRKR
jgi:small subunit ribosomal protein S9